jgi:hypothetical protein
MIKSEKDKGTNSFTLPPNAFGRGSVFEAMALISESRSRDDDPTRKRWILKEQTVTDGGEIINIWKTGGGRFKETITSSGRRLTCLSLLRRRG